MVRLRGHAALVDWVELERQAHATSAKIQYRRARCEHGKTREETCRSCEGGYVQDTSEYARLPETVAAVAVSDDGYDVAFIQGGGRGR
jgi:hypothetical protein